jgi:putative DNA methylase
MSTARKSLLEVQFPIAQLSLESFLERDARSGKVLNSLGKWWGTKPVVLTRAVILAALFEASDDPAEWPKDLEIFFRLMCFDSDGMWKRRNQDLQANSSKPPYLRFSELCFELADETEKELFREEVYWRPRLNQEDRDRREALEKRVFYTLDHSTQRRYTGRVEEIDGPPEDSWKAINAYCKTCASSLQEWVEEMSVRRYGRTLRVGDAFSGMGSIPFAAAQLGCDVYASDLNPVACLLSTGALKLIGGPEDFLAKVLKAQDDLYQEMDAWYESNGLETSVEGWRATLYLYCVEVVVPEWDGWRVPLNGSWQVLKNNKKIWAELVPIPEEKRFSFKIRFGGDGYAAAAAGTKVGADVVCPDSLWEILHSQGKTENATRRIPLNTLIANHGGLRNWEKSDIAPRGDDFYTERLYCIRWENDKGKTEFREPDDLDEAKETECESIVRKNLNEWQEKGWIPDWRIQDGNETSRLRRERGWTFWHHLFTPRQLLMASEYSRRIGKCPMNLRWTLVLALGEIINYSARLSRWDSVGNSAKEVFYNQALNTMIAYLGRAWKMMSNPANSEHFSVPGSGNSLCEMSDARAVGNSCDLWITDPPYADAVNYSELSEFFLAWYKPHINACFPEWYADSKRGDAVQGDDAGFRVAMSECYSNLAKQMPNDGLQVLMFTHKDTEVWEDLALIMWSAGLQVKQVWSIATETGAGGIKKGNYVQATYNMVLRKRPADAPMGFEEFIVDKIKARVTEVITHMRRSQLEAGPLSCGYTDTDYLLAAQAVAAEVVTGYSAISGIDLDEELRTPNRERNPDSALRVLMTLAKRAAVEFLVPQGLEEHLTRTADAINAHTFWRGLCGEEKFLLKGLEMEKGGENRIGTFQDLGRAYGIGDYEDLLGPVAANNARTQLPTEFSRPDMTAWDDVPAADRASFAHCVTRHLYYAISLLAGGADSERAVKHLVDCTNFWEDRHSQHLVLLGYLYQTTQSIEAWNELRPHVQTLRLAVENHRA